MLVLSLPSPAPPVSANALHLETTGNGTAPARQRLACTRTRKLSWLEHGRCSPTSLSRNGALLSLPSGGEARESDTGFHYANENENFCKPPLAGVACGVPGRRKKQDTMSNLFSPAVSYTVATLKSQERHTGAENVGPALLQSTGFTNGTRSPARGRMDRRGFITEDEDRMGVSTRTEARSRSKRREAL